MEKKIPSKRLQDAIYQMIDKEMNEDEMSWGYGTNEDGDEQDENIMEFYGLNFQSGYENEPYFSYIKKEYYENIIQHGSPGNKKWATEWLAVAPFVEIYKTTRWRKKMDKVFGNIWYPVFGLWFKEKFPELPVKNFI